MNHVARSDVVFSSMEDPDPNTHPLLTITLAECVRIPGDINWDCYVDLNDLLEMSEQWLGCEYDTADIFDEGDGCVDMSDLSFMGKYWGKCSDPDSNDCNWTAP